jgi:hypothetical protein
MNMRGEPNFDKSCISNIADPRQLGGGGRSFRKNKNSTYKGEEFMGKLANGDSEKF